MTTATTDLRHLEALRGVFGDGAAERKATLLKRIERARLRTADQVRRLHELLLYWRAFPESTEVLALVERLLEGFERRADLRTHRRTLADSGIAGTELNFQFYWLMATRLAERWPQHLAIDWRSFANSKKLTEILHLLMPYSETPGLDAFGYSAREWIERLKGEGETDAAFLIRRFDALRVPRAVCEHIYEEIDPPVRLLPGPNTPSRTREKWDGAPIVFQQRPPSHERPALRREVAAIRMQVRNLPPREARVLIELANAAMIPRHRDLLVFLHADENDVRIIDFGDGLQFACIGTMPDRRLLLESVYGFLTLRNGVPVGYVLASALYGSCELAYNVFEPFRGAEAARVYARFVACVRHVFGADCFVVDPYQLGHNNREGQVSGAWWFYYKLGFRPRDAGVRALVREELARVAADRTYRSSPARVNRLAAAPMYFSLGRQRADVLGRLPLGDIGLQISNYLAQRFGADRERGLRAASAQAARLLGLRKLAALPPGERLAWERWSPLVLALPGVARWSQAQRRALAAVVRAKGGKRESDFVRLFDAHKPLRRALLELGRRD